METFFKSDPQIREWVDQITERIFAVCLLSGEDADTEFQNGCNIVMDIASLLQGIPSMPSEFLLDGVKQLLEQQLPEKGVINNFPAFPTNMDRMLQAGVLMAINAKNEDPIDNVELSKCEDKAKIGEKITKEELQIAKNELTIACAEEQLRINPEKHRDAHEMRLKNVLKNIFPDSTIYWNQSIRGQLFLAQVEDLLIYVSDNIQPYSSTKYDQGNMKVYVCSQEDLAYPRRLERGIKQFLRSGKKSAVH